MLCGTRYRILNSLSTFRLLNVQLGNIYCTRMSVTEENISVQDADEIQKVNKRHMVDENNEVVPKVQKTEEVQRIKKKHYALMMAYLGKDYYGMQRNRGMRTIEEDLMTALLKADLVTEENLVNPRTINFQRAARTDKGVSAVRQIINLRLPEEVKIANINQYLPNVIRVFGLKRVTKGFNSKNQCNARTYRYIIPSHAFAPEDESFLKCTEEIDVEKRLEELSTIDGKSYVEYRLTPEQIDRINKITKFFHGTHNFHNFTSKVKPLDPRAKRYIISFSCVETFISNNMEFVILEIKGQSFMLHQIRKMVALVVSIIRNNVTEELVNEAFKTKKLAIAIAPSLGLALNYVHYDRYNKRYGNDGIHEMLDWSESDEEVEKFHKDFIVKHVVDTEIAEKTTLNWLAGITPDRFEMKIESTA